MADTATLMVWLAEAETALHQVETGQKAVSLSHAGKSVTYNQANASKLRAYIASLKTQLGQPSGRPKPIGVYF